MAVRPAVRSVGVVGKTLEVVQGQLRLSGLESCREEGEREFLLDGLTRTETPALTQCLAFAGSLVYADARAETARQGTVVVPPEDEASALVREVVAATIGTIEADRVLEERVSVDVVDLAHLVHRPVHAFR